MSGFRTTHPQPNAPRPFRFPNVERRRLSNGVRVVVAEARSAPITAIRCLVEAGADRDPDDRPGLAAMTADLLDEGTSRYGAMDLAGKVADLGALLATGADWDASWGSVELLSRFTGQGLDLLSEVWLRPTFPDEEIERVRRETLTAILQQRDVPSAIAANQFARVVFGGTPYGRSVIGTAESVRAMTRAEIDGFYRANFLPRSTSLIVAGDVAAAEVFDAVERHFDAWKAESAPSAVAVTPVRPEKARIVLVDRPGSVQSEIRIGHVGVPRSCDDYIPLLVMNSILGGVFTSRLNLNLRERHGFTYGIRSAWGFRRHGGPFVVSTAVRNEVTYQAVREIVSELRAIREGNVAAEELEQSKNYMTGVFPATVQGADNLAARLQEMELYGLPDDYFETYRERIESVSAEDVQRVAARYLDPDRVAIVVVGAADHVHEPLSELGLDIGRYDIDGMPLE